MREAPKWIPSYQPPESAAVKVAEDVSRRYYAQAEKALMFVWKLSRPFLSRDNSYVASHRVTEFALLHQRMISATNTLTKGAYIAAAEHERRYEGAELPTLVRCANDDTINVFAPYVRKAEKENRRMSEAIDRLIAECAVEIGRAPKGAELLEALRRQQEAAYEASFNVTEEPRTGKPLPRPNDEEAVEARIGARFAGCLMRAMIEDDNGQLPYDPEPVGPLTRQMSAVYRRTAELAGIAADAAT